jgi:hypothetical protein
MHRECADRVGRMTRSATRVGCPMYAVRRHISGALSLVPLLQCSRSTPSSRFSSGGCIGRGATSVGSEINAFREGGNAICGRIFFTRQNEGDPRASMGESPSLVSSPGPCFLSPSNVNPAKSSRSFLVVHFVITSLAREVCKQDLRGLGGSWWVLSSRGMDQEQAPGPCSALEGAGLSTAAARRGRHI